METGRWGRISFPCPDLDVVGGQTRRGGTDFTPECVPGVCRPVSIVREFLPWLLAYQTQLAW